MSILLDLFDIVRYFYESRRVEEKDIEKNIRYLKQQQWFQNYLKHPEIYKVIVYDRDVREWIGKLKYKKLNHPSYVEKVRKKIGKLLSKKIDIVIH
ncbi:MULTISPECIES: hypothetical protein [Virgibacillus]|uniref:Uncharacterized protein n=1 Tax=Virgibacillus dokdonensis TaxID=302167 RepID=A0A2K9J304_9BACI|nr:MULTISPECIES: hypothetical protein [Virgibacillus]AUJ23380.1 hypothetical protein A21D_00267 [Virgibacillus dokdonensis]NWO12082.1 hypothetical protein [Virgibacillus sp.]